jgi:hypothetical protein
MDLKSWSVWLLLRCSALLFMMLLALTDFIKEQSLRFWECSTEQLEGYSECVTYSEK